MTPEDRRPSLDRWLDRALLALLMVVCATWSAMGLAVLSLWWRLS